MAHRLLFIEDNTHKRAKIIEFLKSLPMSIEIHEAHSYTSGCQQLDAGKFDFALVDISLPTYDRTALEAGGRFRAFAGREIARRIIRQGGVNKIVFITQYSSFSEKGNSYSFEELRSLLSSECGRLFGDLIFFDSSHSAWKDALAHQLPVVEN